MATFFYSLCYRQVYWIKNELRFKWVFVNLCLVNTCIDLAWKNPLKLMIEIEHIWFKIKGGKWHIKTQPFIQQHTHSTCQLQNNIPIRIRMVVPRHIANPTRIEEDVERKRVYCDIKHQLKSSVTKRYDNTHLCVAWVILHDSKQKSLLMIRSKADKSYKRECHDSII